MARYTQSVNVVTRAYSENSQATRLRQLEEQNHAGAVGSVPSEQDDDEQVYSPSAASYARTRKLQAARLLQLEEQNRQLLQANEEARARHQAVSLRLIEYRKLITDCCRCTACARQGYCQYRSTVVSWNMAIGRSCSDLPIPTVIAGGAVVGRSATRLAGFSSSLTGASESR